MQFVFAGGYLYLCICTSIFSLSIMAFFLIKIIFYLEPMILITSRACKRSCEPLAPPLGFEMSILVTVDGKDYPLKPQNVVYKTLH